MNFQVLLYFYYNRLLQYTMQEDQIAMLPRRKTGLSTLKNAKKIMFCTNNYNVDLTPIKLIYQYCIQIEPQIPQDSTFLIAKTIKNLKKTLQKQIGLLSYSGLMLWGRKNIKIPLTLKSSFQFNGMNYSFDILIRMTKTLNFEDLLKDPANKPKAIQILNSGIKNTLKGYMEMISLKKGQYFEKQDILLQDYPLDIKIGFNITFLTISKQHLLQIDNCSRVLQAKTFWEQIQGLKMQSIKQYEDRIVITTYGIQKIYKIFSIQFDMSPLSTFCYDENDGNEITYVQYFKKKYGIKLIQMKQPMLKVMSHYTQIHKGQKLQKTQNFIYLPPELVRLTGLLDQQRKNNSIMKQVANYTKLTPDQRNQNIEKLIKQFNKDSNSIIKIYQQPNSVQGFIIDSPSIILGHSETQSKSGNFELNEPLLKRAVFQNWIAVASTNDKIQQALKYFNIASQRYQISIKKPTKIILKNIENLKTDISNFVKKSEKPIQIVFLILERNQERYYDEIKRFLTVELQIPCQIVRTSTIFVGKNSKKDPISISTKLIHQMSAKINCPLWQIPPPKQLAGKKVMYASIAISKGNGGYTVSLVGTTNNEFTTVYSDYWIKIKRKEQIPKIVFESLFNGWGKAYFKKMGTAPDVIIVYRQGLADTQLMHNLNEQIEALYGIVKKIGKTNKINNYKPKIIYFTVNKKVNQRFFNQPSQKQRRGNFPSKLQNPPSGSVIVQGLSTNEHIDFYLAAQKVTQGTCTLTHYTVAHQSKDFDLGPIIKFTFYQCFNYFNWSGAVKVPACLQYANKLATLMSQHVRTQSQKQNRLQGSLYYL